MKNKRNILTHRGLEPGKPSFFRESSLEAFTNHVQRGFGIEFDVNFVRDGVVIHHDPNLSRVTQGQDTRLLMNMTKKEFLELKVSGGTNCDLEQILELLDEKSQAMNACHVKGSYQETPFLERLLAHLREVPLLLEKIVFFDLKWQAASFLKEKMPDLQLGCSVAHAYDIKRYNPCTKGTLFSMEETMGHREIFSWAFLDEWDRSDEWGGVKELYTQENFLSLRNKGFQLAVISPELHASSPGLLGGECHPDSVSNERLWERTRQILSLGPDLYCTDFPEEVLNLWSGIDQGINGHLNPR